MSCLLYSTYVRGFGNFGDYCSPLCAIAHGQMSTYFVHEVGHVLGAHHDQNTLDGKVIKFELYNRVTIWEIG